MSSKISAKTQLCMVIGQPVCHSLSPAMHNAAYRELGIDDRFVYVASEIDTSDLGIAMAAVRAMSIRGLSCTVPYKTAVMKYLDEIDPVAEKIGAVNTVVNDGNSLKGYNTDWLGVLVPMEEMLELKGKRVAILGAGGAARAMLFAVASRGAQPKVFNRTKERAEALAGDFPSCACGTLDELDELVDFDVILNSTTVGMGSDLEESLVAPELLRKAHIVLDAVYMPPETKLLRDAKSKGASVISGLDMLLYQGMAQFDYYTGMDAPKDAMREALKVAVGV